MKINEIYENVITKKTTARQTVEQAIARAHKCKDSNALLSISEDRALKRADEIDQMIKAGKSVGRLAGVPFVAKDNYLTFGGETTAASKILANFEAPVQATIIEKLEAEGAICIGKANLDAFAHGGSTENSAYGPTKNAFDKTRVAGGSSGGSAVVTALDIVPFALGSDTGGSIRQPASFNGVYGMKPTYGLASRYGVVAMASSTDCMGCFAHSAEDIALLTDIIAGRDAKDMTTLPDFFKPVNLSDKKLRVGIIKETMTEQVDPEVRAITGQYIEKLKTQGHSVEEVTMPIVSYALAMYYVIVSAEVCSNLARYDGVRYGVRSSDARNLSEIYGLSREQGFEAENKRRIMIGSYVLSSGYFDAYYLKAQKARTLLIDAFKEQFSKYDILITPTAPTPAFKLGENTNDPVAMYMSDVMTVPASLAGLPALSVPAGKTKEGLPVGVQLIGDMKQDAIVIALAESMEE